MDPDCVDGVKRADKNGTPYSAFDNRPASEKNVSPEPTGTQNGARKASPEICHRIYTAMLDALFLSSGHREKLHKRGFTTRQIRQLEENGYRSLGQERSKAVQTLARDPDIERLLPGVPGFYVTTTTRSPRWSIGGAGGLLLPVRDTHGEIVALKVRPDEIKPGDKGKYKWITSKSKNRGGPGPGSPVHVPLFSGDSSTVRVTEGEIKADIATMVTGMLTISIPGVGQWREAKAVLHDLGAKVVRVALDADACTNNTVASAIVSLVTDLGKSGFVVELEQWDIAHGKGIDDLLLANKSPQVLTGDDAIGCARLILEQANQVKGGNPIPPNGQHDGGPALDPSGRTVVLVTTQEMRVNNAAAATLINDPDLYQRGGSLVTVCRETSPPGSLVRRSNGMHIQRISRSTFRERLSHLVDFTQERQTAEGVETLSIHPPPWCVPAVFDRGYWEGVRPLVGITNHPILRPDGTICSTIGYDPATGFLLASCGDVPAIPEHPTRADALAAWAELQEVICDFPFQAQVHKSAWLAALITALARTAFDGPVPLFLIDANVRAAGKGLLSDTIALILTGERFTVMSYTPDEDELRKRITTIVIAGDPLVLFDNLTGKFGSGTLDAALTATAWKDRVLGASEQVNLPLSVGWYATGNNVSIGGDTARRVCHIRLESPEENPELRTDVKHPDLRDWVRQNRPRLLRAALVILRAWFAADQPKHNMPAWGSFEGWSRVIRNTVVWLGLPDPAETREELATQADDVAERMMLVIQVWEKLDPDQLGLTAAKVVKEISPPPLGTTPTRTLPDGADELRAMLQDKNGIVTSYKLGLMLRSYRRRIFGGKYLDLVGTEKRAGKWTVFPASMFRQPTQTDTKSTGMGEDGEDSEDTSPSAEALFWEDEKGKKPIQHPGETSSLSSPSSPYTFVEEGVI
jgi:Domain of unknown function (DUF3854)